LRILGMGRLKPAKKIAFFSPIADA